jgi:4-hydroxythreonine-4-phosphate dehydrogenase
MKNAQLKVGITQGDINGIGYEIIIKTLIDNRINDICTPIVYGSPKVAAYHRKALNISNFSFNHIKTPQEANLKRANIINCLDDDVRVELGKSTRIAGDASAKSLERAVSDMKKGEIDVLVTAPINKHNIQSDNFSFPGHTEYLESFFKADGALMLMVADFFKVGVVTGHIPFSKISSFITIENIVDKIRIMNKSLIEDFIIRKPQIAVLGLNPHAGDEGLLGDEEEKIINPAIQMARDEDILVFGPFAADGLFSSNACSKFDAILAMYHDQGLAPFKALAFKSGVNFTAGLSIVRTSPVHGTAYELAGRSMALPDSFRQALYMAIDIYHNRLVNKELNKDPLREHEIDDL